LIARNASSPKSRRIRWGIIGTGFMACNRMIPAILSTEDCEIVAVAGGNRERADAVARKFEIPSAYDSVEELLWAKTVDAVYIGSKNNEHAGHVIAAARAGKHVLAEKPVALTLDEAIAMYNACAAADVVFGTNHYHRLKPSHSTMRRLIEEGALGNVLSAQLTFAIQLAPEQRTWRLNSQAVGGGVILDLTVHDADIVRAMFGTDVIQVMAASAKRDTPGGELDDTAAGVLQMRSGALVSFLDSFVAPNPIHDIVVVGTKATVVGDTVMRSDSDGTVTLRQAGSAQAVELPPWENPFRISIRAFNQAVRENGSPAVSGVDGIKSLAVALAAVESAQTGCRVSVPDIDALLAHPSSASRTLHTD
jgi:1,5-anhydro-D-fructose reductase (1,5-anhydro-D-mannitol-forming)